MTPTPRQRTSQILRSTNQNNRCKYLFKKNNIFIFLVFKTVPLIFFFLDSLRVRRRMNAVLKSFDDLRRCTVTSKLIFGDIFYYFCPLNTSYVIVCPHCNTPSFNQCVKHCSMNDDNSHNLMFENITELTWRRNRLTELFIENDIYEYVDVVTTNVNCQPDTNLF